MSKKDQKIVASHTHDVDSKNALHAVKQTLQPQSNLSPRYESRNPGHVELAGIQNEVLAKNLQVLALSTPPSRWWKKLAELKFKGSRLMFGSFVRRYKASLPIAHADHNIFQNEKKNFSLFHGWQK